MKNIKKYFDIGVLITIIVGQIISIIVETLDAQKNGENILSSSIIIVFAIFCISVYFEMLNFKENISRRVKNIQQSSNIANTKTGKGSDDFYRLALEYMNVTSSSIWVTSLNDRNPNIKGSEMRRKYFDSFYPFAKKNQTVDIKRIVKIPTLDKLEWVRKQIESTQRLDNVSIAYIENDVNILNLLIFDEKIMLLWNTGQDKVSQKHNKFIYSENVDVVEMFAEYYEKLWKQLENNHGGFILKQGTHININETNQRLQKIKDKIENGGT